MLPKAVLPRCEGEGGREQGGNEWQKGVHLEGPREGERERGWGERVHDSRGIDWPHNLDLD